MSGSPDGVHRGTATQIKDGTKSPGPDHSGGNAPAKPDDAPPPPDVHRG